MQDRPVSVFGGKSRKWAEGDPLRILLALSALTAGLSAFLDNGPLDGPGTATLIGDPPNIMIGQGERAPYVRSMRFSSIWELFFP